MLQAIRVHFGFCESYHKQVDTLCPWVCPSKCARHQNGFSA